MVFFGNFDIALLALYAFWVFFAGLIVYLQRENSREGYPLVNTATGRRDVPAIFGQPDKKVFKLDHGREDRVLDRDGNPDERDIEGRPVERSLGTAYEPTTENPLDSGLGPAAYAMRPDVPDLNAHGEPKIVPLSGRQNWSFADADITGWEVFGGDGRKAGTVEDVWIDTGESLVRYVQVGTGGGSRLVPMTAMIVDKARRAGYVHSLYAGQFAGIPATASGSQITMLEEEKVQAYIAGGKLYADPRRREVLL